jgi:hypothetical protein
MEGVKNKRRQTDKIEMKSMWSPGSFQENKYAYEKINEPNELQIFLVSKERLFSPQDDGGRDFPLASNNSVGCSLPAPQIVQNPRDLPVVPDRLAVYRLQNVPALDPSLICWTVVDNDLCSDTGWALDPEDSIVRRSIASLLLDIQAAQKQHCNRQQNGCDVFEREDLSTHLCPV